MSLIPQFKVFMALNAPDVVGKTLMSGYIGQGPMVKKFEEKLAAIFKSRNVVTVNSGTSALRLALMLEGIGPGDSVVSTPMTCVATNTSIALTGAEIIWADVDKYGNISPSSVYESIRENTRAVVAVDWGGLPCDFSELRQAIEHRERDYGTSITLIQDAAHAIMSTYQGKHVAECSDYAAFSFQAIKHLTTGDGGALVTPGDMYEKAVLMRWYGFDRRYSDRMRCLQDLSVIGDKLHMNDIAASIGLANIPYLDEIIAGHRFIADIYDKEFINMGLPPEWPSDRESSFWLYTIHINDVDIFESFMNSHDVQVSKVHVRNDIYSAFRQSKKPLPNLDDWYRDMICLPIGWWMDEQDAKRVIDLVKRFMSMGH